MTQERRDAIMTEILTKDFRAGFDEWMGEFRETYPEIVEKFDGERRGFLSAAMFRGLMLGLEWAKRFDV